MMMRRRTATSFLCLLLTLVAGDRKCDWRDCAGATDFSWNNVTGQWYVRSYQDVAPGTPESIVAEMKSAGNRMRVKEKVVSSSHKTKCVEKVFHCINDGSKTTCKTCHNEEVTVTVLAHINYQEAVVRVMKGTELEGVYLKKYVSLGRVRFRQLKRKLNDCDECRYAIFTTVNYMSHSSCDF